MKRQPITFQEFKTKLGILRANNKELKKNKLTPFKFFKIGWQNTFTIKHILFCVFAPILFTFLMVSVQFVLSKGIAHFSDRYNPNGSVLSIFLYFILAGPLYYFIVLFLRKEKESNIKIWYSLKKNWLAAFIWGLPIIFLFSFIYILFYNLAMMQFNGGVHLNLLIISVYVLLPMTFCYLYFIHGIYFFSALAEKNSYNLKTTKSTLKIYWICTKMFFSNFHYIFSCFGYTLVFTGLLFIPVPILIINYFFIILGADINPALPNVGYLLIAVFSFIIIIFSIAAFIKAIMSTYKNAINKGHHLIFTSNVYGEGVSQWKTQSNEPLEKSFNNEL